MQARKTETFPALTGLRFIAAFSVVVGHSLPHLFPIKDGAIPTWYQLLGSLPGLGMPLFFTLSGFVIYYNYCDILDHRPAKGLWRFFVARFSRLYPLFLLVVAVDLIKLWGFQVLPAGTATALPYYLTLTQTWMYTVVDEKTLPQIFGVMPTIAWSISTEWFFYLAFPLVCALVVRCKTILACVAGIFLAFMIWGGALLFVGTYWSEIDLWATGIWGEVAGQAYQAKIPGQSFIRWLLYLSPYFEIGAFVVGCLVAAAIRLAMKNPPSASEMKYGQIGTIAGLVLIVAASTYLYMGTGGTVFLATKISCLLVVPGIALLIFCLARYESWTKRVLSGPTMVRFDEASYSLYLLHMPLIMAFRWEVAPLREGVFPITNLAHSLPFAVALIGAAIISYEYYEMPAQRFLRRLLLPKRDPVLKPAE